MKVLMLNFGPRWQGTYYRPFNWGRHLVRCGHRVTIACGPRLGGGPGRISVDAGMRIVEAPGFLDPSRFLIRLGGLPGWGALDILGRILELRDGGYDIVHVFEHAPNVTLPAGLLQVRRPPALVADWCDHFGRGGFRDEDHYRLERVYRVLGEPVRRLLDRWERTLRIKARAVTVISDFLRRRAVGLGVAAEKIRLIRGSVDTAAVRPLAKPAARARWGLGAADRIVGFLGSFQADLDLTMAAVAAAAADLPALKLLIIGRRNPSLERLAETLGIADRVVQTDWCSEADLPWYLAAADAFIMPMKDNPINRARWPNKIGEYMAAGRPTIASRVGDVAELIDREGFGVTAGPSAPEMAAAISALLRDGDRLEAMGERARRIAERDFSLDVQGAQVEGLYRSLVPRAAPAGSPHE